jgi:hypothetical protein
MDTAEPLETSAPVSTSRPSTRPAIAAAARRGPIDAATSATVAPAATDLTLPSGSVMEI